MHLTKITRVIKKRQDSIRNAANTGHPALVQRSHTTSVYEGDWAYHVKESTFLCGPTSQANMGCLT